MSVPRDMAEARALVAEGTLLREALDAVVAGRLGALVAIGDEEAVSALADGGFAMDAPFTPAALYELCKMDGGVILDGGLTRVLRANVHFVPDRSLVTPETGIRHRSAQQLAMATSALVVSVSRRRGTIALYLGESRGTVSRG